MTQLMTREPAWGPASTKTIEWYDPMISAAAVADMTGLEFLQAIKAGDLPPAPIACLLGVAIEALEEGRVVFTCTPDESVYNPIGVVHGGLVCTLADTVAACAVQSTLGRGIGYTSIDLNVGYLRAVTKDSGQLRAVGTLTKPGRRVAFAKAEIFDGVGKLVAEASTRCLIIPAPGLPA